MNPADLPIRTMSLPPAPETNLQGIIDELELELAACHFEPAGGLPGWLASPEDRRWSLLEGDTFLYVTAIFDGEGRRWRWHACVGTERRRGIEPYCRGAMRRAEEMVETLRPGGEL